MLKAYMEAAKNSTALNGILATVPAITGPMRDTARLREPYMEQQPARRLRADAMKEPRG